MFAAHHISGSEGRPWPIPRGTFFCRIKIGGAEPRRFTSYFSRMAAKNALSSARLS